MSDESAVAPGVSVVATDAVRQARNATPKQPFSIKELLTGITIAFTMAFVFRGFVVEGFLIPTGSMAPTLLGQHVRIADPATGYEWTVGPWDYAGGTQAGPPLGLQGSAATGPIVVNDPMSRGEVAQSNTPLLAGDRLFVMKYLEGVHEPRRWEVVVFKVPTGPQENYIKRLVGLPGEQLALIDGDVFTRTPPSGEDRDGVAAWLAPGWAIARKPERVQRAMLQPVFDSRYTPAPGTVDRYRPPLAAEGGGWEGLSESATWRYEGTAATALTWDTARYPIDDYTPYNQSGPRHAGYQDFQRRPKDGRTPRIDIYPVSDVAVELAVEPRGGGAGGVTIDLEARGWQFRAEVAGGKARLARRIAGSGDGAWQEIASGSATLAAGRVTRVEFWHVDQALWLFVDGRLVAGGADAGGYTMTPADRVWAATGRHLVDWMSTSPDPRASPLASAGAYRGTGLTIGFTGGPLTVHRAAVSRDIYYQPGQSMPGRDTGLSSRGAHPLNMPDLGEDFYFFCGDNSPNSADSRAWSDVDPWVTATVHGLEAGAVDPSAGLVHRDLLIGRAFVVYLPAPARREPVGLPMLDFGRMRWVW